MKTRIAAILVALVALPALLLLGKQATVLTRPLSKTTQQETTVMEGDILFQSSEGGQGKAIQLATKSKYNHCGMVVIKGAELYVLEANGPVGLTPYIDFINRCDGHYVTKRLKNREKYFTDSTTRILKAEESKYLNIKYDPYFGWNDSLMYCSELVWKVYRRSMGIEVGKLQQLKDFDLSHPIVKAKLEERFGKNIPYQENVISPAAIFDSPLLTTVDMK
jgi:hypothetical protein